MHLNLFVSQKCFLYCKGCYSFSRIEKAGQTLDTQKIIEFLKYAYDHGIDKVTLCGGDPLTRNDIINLLKMIKSIGYYISIDTVGTSIIRDVVKNDGTITKKIDAKDLSELVDEIGLPIDGSNNEIFRKFRQTDFDLLSDQLKICNELNKYGINICINTVVHKENLNDAKLLCEIINKLNYIKKWQLFKYAPMGKYGVLNRKQFEISEIQFEEYKQNILNACLRKDIIDFKDFDVRTKLYMLIDNSGNAWIPEYNQGMFDNYNIVTDSRKIIGNITNQTDWSGLCKILKLGENKNET